MMRDKPTAIHSKILNTTIYLSETPLPGKVCFNQKEVEELKKAEEWMTKEEYSDYLRKLYETKKVFPGAQIEEIKQNAPAPEKEEKEAKLPTPEPEQKNFWEL